MARQTDEQALLDLVPHGRSIGRGALLRKLQEARSWTEAKYGRVLQRLIDKGLLVAGSGRGGSVRRPEEPADDRAKGEGIKVESLPDDSGPAQLPLLKSVCFKSWKSFRDATLYIDPLTVLIGANASGKSNALDGLQFLNRITLGKELSAALGGDPTLSPLRGGVELAALQGTSRFTLEVAVRGEEEGTEYFYSITVDTQPRVQVRHESLKRLRRRSRGGESSFEIFGQLAGQLVGLRLLQDVHVGAAAVSRALRSIFILDAIPSSMRGFSPFADGLRSDASNIAGVLAALPPRQKADVEATLTSYIRDLPERDVRKVWAEPVGRFKTDAMLYCEEAWVPDGPPTTVDARGMSDGTLRMLAIITALLTRPEGSVLVIEEVDNGLHPSRSELLLRTLRELGARRRIDVLVTTHNPALLDALGPEMVPFVTVAHRDPSTGESRLTLLEELDALPKLMASGSLGALSARGQLEKSLEEEARSA